MGGCQGLGGERLLIYKERAPWSFWGDWTVLYLDHGACYTSLYMC